MLVLLLLLAACAPEQPEVIYVVVTSDGSSAVIVAAATNTPPPTETPVPTPTTPPDIALQLANRALLDGYFERAVNTYQIIIAQGDSVPADLRAQAALGLAQAALREGLFTEAVNALTTLITLFPQDPRAAQAYYMRADAYMGLSMWNDAINDYNTYLTLRPGLIDSYAHEGIADALLALGETANALASYEQAIAGSRTLVPLLQLREKTAQVYLNSGQAGQAVAQYDAILAVARNEPYRAAIEYAAAQAQIAGGDTQGGLARMRRVFDDYQQTQQAYLAMQVLDNSGVDLDNYARGTAAYYYGDYELAIEAFSTYGTQMQLAAIPAQMYMLLGRAYREIGNAAAALTAFQTVISQYPNDPLFGEALLEQGRTRFLSNDIPGAIRQYLFIADNYGYLAETAAEALWRAGYLYSTNDDPAQGRVIFERLADTYPSSEQARSGLFIAASAAVNAGETLAAETLFARLATSTTGEDQAAAYLWVGRLAQMRGDGATAQRAFDLAAQAAPDSYFGARARDITSGVQPFQPPATYVFEFDELAQLTEAENWLRSAFAVTQEGALWPLSAALENDARMVRGRELWTMGHFNEAETEFYDMLEVYQNDGLASYQLAIIFRAIGAYAPSITGAANVLRAANISTLNAPTYIARMRYPTYYRDIVLDAAQRRGIDPLLMFALIRQESLFDATATAAAGEIGLMQVIPSTGEYIASELNWPNYQHSDLFRPYAAVEFGAFYLDEQLERFGGNAMAALAGYNAGPGRAAAWLELSGGDPDLFMTTITIDSTRGYVQRIYSHYTIYRALYGG
ncbi:MAG: transglycosylase SLT domain-containing protein [Chloroflexi bacterium]|nr:transglycosylase SLT domain-containing protein [Chloroflexota bacterium]